MLKEENAIRIAYKNQKVKGSSRIFKRKYYVFLCAECGSEIKVSKHELLKNIRSDKCRKCCRSGKPFQRTFSRLKYSNMGKVTLTYEDYLKFTEIKTCHYCSNSLIWIPHGPKSYRSNLDRKNPTGNYSNENCVACCWDCNEMKSNKFSYEEFLLLKPALETINKNRKDDCKVS